MGRRRLRPFILWFLLSSVSGKGNSKSRITTLKLSTAERNIWVLPGQRGCFFRLVLLDNTAQKRGGVVLRTSLLFTLNRQEGFHYVHCSYLSATFNPGLTAHYQQLCPVITIHPSSFNFHQHTNTITPSENFSSKWASRS